MLSPELQVLDLQRDGSTTLRMPDALRRSVRPGICIGREFTVCQGQKMVWYVLDLVESVNTAAAVLGRRCKSVIVCDNC